MTTLEHGRTAIGRNICVYDDGATEHVITDRLRALMVQMMKPDTPKEWLVETDSLPDEVAAEVRGAFHGQKGKSKFVLVLGENGTSMWAII